MQKLECRRPGNEAKAPTKTNTAVIAMFLLSPLGGHLLPSLVQAVDGGTLQTSQNGLQGVVVTQMVALACNLRKNHNMRECREL